VVPSTLWALEIMARHGIEYDSSVFPFARGRYGIDGYPNPLPHAVKLPGGSSILEFPMSTMKWGGKTLPIAGGGYFRLYPHRVTERYIEDANRRGLPAMVYLHPWEIDAAQERHSLGLWKGFQHYVNLEQTEWKLNRLLQRFEFGSVAEGMELPRVRSLLARNPVDARFLGGATRPAVPAGARPLSVRRKAETGAQPAPVLSPHAGGPAAGDPRKGPERPDSGVEGADLEIIGADGFGRRAG
jgi:hypothetical protein